MFIYKITNLVNNKVYIGQTIRDPEIRFQEHLHNSKGKEYLPCAIRHYGKENFIMEVIDTATSQQELDEKEIFWISYYNSYYDAPNSNGYNLTLGGDSNPMNCEEVQKKHLTSMRSEEVRNKISATIKKRIEEGTLFTEEHRKNLSKAMKGNQHFKGHKRTQSAIEATSKALHKKVYCIDEQGNVVNRFDSVVSACEWWYPEYIKHRTCKYYKCLSDVIKLSSTKDKYILGLKWIYE